jgi:hypothetical protein
MRPVEVLGQLGVGPIGPVQALPGRPLDDPAADLLGRPGRDPGLGPPGLAGPEPGEAESQVEVEPPLDGARGDGQVGGDLLMGPVPVGHQDDPEAVPERPVGRLAECLLDLSGFSFAESDADHGDECCRVQKGVYPLNEPDSLIGRVNGERVGRGPYLPPAR